MWSEMKPALEERGDVHGLHGGARREALFDLPILSVDDQTTIRNPSLLETVPCTQARIIRARCCGVVGQTRPPIHEGVRRHGDSVSVAETERGCGRNESGSIRIPHEGAIASHRARDLIRALADLQEGALRAVQSSGLLHAPNVPRFFVEDFEHRIADVATTAARPPSEVRALKKGCASCRRA